MVSLASVSAPLLLALSMLGVSESGGTSAPASPGPPPIIDPATYLSFSQEWRLFVDPAEWHGKGAADTHLEQRKNGEWQTAWRKKLPFTLWDARVSNEGVVAGYSTHGEVFADSLWIGAFDASGDELWSTDQRIGFGGYQDSRGPAASGLALSEEHGSLLVHIFDTEERGGIGWRKLSLASGEFLGPWEPTIPLGGNDKLNAHLRRLEELPGTDLWVGVWYYVGFGEQGEYGSSISLMHADGLPIWEKSWAGGHRRPWDVGSDIGMSDWIRENSLVLDPGDKPAFWALDMKAQVYEKYEVSASFEVAQTAARPADLEKPGPLPASIELDLIRETNLAVPGAPRGLSVGLVAHRYSVRIAPSGRLFVKAERAVNVCVFDAQGEFEFACEPGEINSEGTEARKRKERGDPWMETLYTDGCIEDPNGDVLVPISWERRTGNTVPRYARFRAGGERDGTLYLIGGDVHLDPKGRGYWATPDLTTSLEKRSATGGVLAVLTRGTDNRWFRSRSQAMDGQGDLVVRGNLIADLAIYDPMGELAKVIPMNGVAARVLAMTDKWILSQVDEADLLLTRRETGVSVPIQLPLASRDAKSWKFGLSPTGTELVAVHDRKLRLLHFALPE